MLGERSEQRGLWEADRLYLDHVGKNTFYGLLASLRGRLFRGPDFAEFYCPDNGRDSVPPSLLATALLLQTHDKVSDAEAKARADFDLRWKVALGIEVEDRPFAKSTLQVFRAQLILHGKVREVFESSLRFARESGYLKRRSMKVALDTTNILGRGAVKDTCNLLADGIVKLMRTLAAVGRTAVKEWAKARGYDRKRPWDRVTPTARLSAKENAPPSLTGHLRSKILFIGANQLLGAKPLSGAGTSRTRTIKLKSNGPKQLSSGLCHSGRFALSSRGWDILSGREYYTYVVVLGTK